MGVLIGRGSQRLVTKQHANTLTHSHTHTLIHSHTHTLAHSHTHTDVRVWETDRQGFLGSISEASVSGASVRWRYIRESEMLEGCLRDA